MGWNATGVPTVRKQRDKWVVRVDGIDTATGKHRPHQLGTYTSQRAALMAARSGRAESRSTERGAVSWLVRRYVAGRTDITLKAREGYEWAIPHIEAGLGAIPVARLDREDVAGWIEDLASGAQLSRRSVQICRTVLRAALAEAVEEGLISRSPAARVALPRSVAKPVTQKEIEAWNAAEIDRFLEASRHHRWAIGFRLGVLYGLRRSEVLALRWDDLDGKAKTLRVDRSLVAVRTGAAWSDAKNERSRRRIPLDDETIRTFSRRRAEQATERLLACPARTIGSSVLRFELAIEGHDLGERGDVVGKFHDETVVTPDVERPEVHVGRNEPSTVVGPEQVGRPPVAQRSRIA
jgi:integrase